MTHPLLASSLTKIPVRSAKKLTEAVSSSVALGKPSITVAQGKEIRSTWPELQGYQTLWANSGNPDSGNPDEALKEKGVNSKPLRASKYCALLGTSSPSHHQLSVVPVLIVGYDTNNPFSTEFSCTQLQRLSRKRIIWGRGFHLSALFQPLLRGQGRVSAKTFDVELERACIVNP